MPSRISPPPTFAVPLSKHQTAIVVTQDGSLTVSNSAPIPQLQPNGALIRTAAVALNPVDAKMLDYSPAPNTVAGYDFAGTVVALGQDAAANSKLQIGDRVAGMVHGMNSLDPAGGAFAEYVTADADLVLRVPESMSWGDAATLGMGVSTAVLGLFVELQVPTKLAALGNAERDNEETGPFVLVAGGSTATGTRAIQLLKLAGFRPIATCSPRHFGLVKRFGASATFDYHDAKTAAAIRTHTQNELAYALDCISTAETTQLCYDALGRAGGRYTALEPFRTAVTSKRSLTVSPSWLLALTIFGKKVALDGEYAREPLPEHHKVGVEAYAAVQKLLDRGLLETHPAKVVKGSWEDVIKGVDEVRGQTLSGVKLVFLVQ
ncbi:chaperonin 10-like protein [Paraphoma chrysanthemicola]|uniref:Chaperonin 10-like protein n=1 Tax=Paraphoma chrysanthemicola TaxID=798071 RepID=A0A8K0QVC7_9PLEO|nr:chaperonin 10-like protein [Paraphoma chrysanthemicola]